MAIASTLASGYAAQTISVDFIGRGNGETPVTLDAAELAGVVPAANWNSVDNQAVNNTGDTPALLDSTGAATPVTLSFVANDSWFNDTTPANATTPDAKMMRGIIKANGAGVAETFTFNNLSDGQYDVYVYMNENGAGSQVNVSDAGNFKTYYVTQDTLFNNASTFKAGVNTDPAGTRDVCNYVKFSGLNTLGGNSLTVKVLHVSGTDGSGVGGLQIVNVGGPAANTAPVAIVTPPANTTAAPGGVAIFSVLASGPQATYQWYKGNDPIDGATSSTYTTPSLVKADNGNTYKVKVSNNVNNVTSAVATLSVVGEAPIAVDFIGRGNGETPVSLEPTEIAGVLAQANWNSVDDAAVDNKGTAENLVDATGAATPVTLTYNANDSWFNDTAVGSATEPNAKMMRGIVKATTTVPATFTWNNVPEGIYDVYVYMNENGDNTFLNIWDSLNFTKFYVAETHQFNDGAAFVQSSNKNPAGTRDVGNYVKFTGINTLGTGSIGITAQYVANSDGAGIAGLQLVQTGPAGPNTVAPEIFSQPAAAAVVQPDPVTFSVVAQGPNLTYKWQRKASGGSTFTDVAGATSASYTLTPTSATADNGAVYRVVVANNVSSVTSSEVALTVTEDHTPPTLVEAGGTVSKVRVTFNEPVDHTTGGAIANYSIPGMTIASATVTDVVNANGKAGVVELTVSGGTVGKLYTLTVNNVQDQAHNTIAANAKAQFFTFTSFADFNDYVLPAGYTLGGSASIDGNGWQGTGGVEITKAAGSLQGGLGIADLSNGTEVTEMSMLFRLFIGQGSGNPADGFSINFANDLPADPSTGEEGTGSGLIISLDTYDNGGGEAPAFSYKIAGSEDGKVVVSKATLVNDRYVYVLVILTADGKLTVIHDGITYADAVDLTAIGYAPITGPSWSFGARTGGEFASQRVDSVGLLINAPLQIPPVTVTINTQPASTSVVENRRVALSVGATVDSFFGGSASYQWQSAPAGGSTFTDIDGATGATYRTPKLTVAESGIQYRVVVSSQGASTTSAAAVVTVTADTVPPVATGAGAVQHKTGVQVGVTFDEPVTAASAGTLANYTLSSGSVTAITVVNNQGGTIYDRGDVVDAILDTTGLTAGSTYTLTVKDVQDLKGNKSVSKTISFTVPDVKWASVGDPFLEPAVAAVGDNGYDVVSGGRGYWGTYDEITFVYKEKTGDFDVKTQIIDQDYNSQWGRAGLAVRESADEDKTEAETQAEEPYLFSAYREIHANPNQTDQDPGPNNNPNANNNFEANQRVGINYGAAANDTSGWGGGGGAPTYPNVWLRLSRVGDTITGYRSINGTDWIQIAQNTWTGAPAKLLVGPGFSPENGNITSDTANYKAYMARYRHFTDTVESTPAPKITGIVRNANGSITVTWTGGGTLETTPAFTGATTTWTAVPGAASPYTFTPPAGVPALFGRIRVP